MTVLISSADIPRCTISCFRAVSSSARRTSVRYLVTVPNTMPKMGTSTPRAMARSQGCSRSSSSMIWSPCALNSNGNKVPGLLKYSSERSEYWNPCRFIHEMTWRSARRGVGLQHPEDVAFGILGVGKPADAGYGHLGQGDAPSVCGGARKVFVEDRHVHGADIGNDLVAARAGVAADHAAVDAGLLLGAGLDEPVIHRAFPLGEVPAKEGAVKADGS